MQSSAIVQLIADLQAAPTRLTSLAATFGQVPDPRRRQGQRYSLPFLLCALVLALLCNCNSLEAVGEWCQAHREELAAHFPTQRFHTPTGSLLRRLLPRLSVEAVEAALAAWSQATLQAPADAADATEALAVDGKTVRGAASAGQSAPHLLSVSTHRSGQTVLQARVDDHTNEIPIARALLPALPVAGRVVTADALHTQVETAQALLDHGADYLLVVKRNQEQLYAECAAYFSDPQATAARETTVERRRGRTETRTLYATARLNAHLARYSRFPRIGQVACLLTTMRDRRGTHRDVRFLLTSLTLQQADPARLLDLWRGHWSVEVRHYIRDVTFGEDRSTLRSGHAPQLLAALRNLALTLIRRAGTTRIAAFRRACAYQPHRAFALLFPPT